MVKNKERVRIYYLDRWEYLMNIHSNDSFKGLDDIRGFVLSKLISSPSPQLKGN